MSVLPSETPTRGRSTSSGLARIVAVAALLFAMAAAPAYAISVRDIIELHRAKVSDDILVALLDADPTLFSLDAAQILELKKAGVSDRVVVAMLHSGRQPRGSEQGAQAVGAEAAAEAAAAGPAESPAVPGAYAMPPASAPNYVVTGQSPELASSAPPLVFVAPTPWAATVVGVPSRARSVAATPYHGFGRFTNDGFVGNQPGRFMNDGFVDATAPSAVPVVTFSTPPAAGAPPPARHAGHHRQ